MHQFAYRFLKKCPTHPLIWEGITFRRLRYLGSPPSATHAQRLRRLMLDAFSRPTFKTIPTPMRQTRPYINVVCLSYSQSKFALVFGFYRCGVVPAIKICAGIYEQFLWFHVLVYSVSHFILFLSAVVLQSSDFVNLIRLYITLITGDNSVTIPCLIAGCTKHIVNIIITITCVSGLAIEDVISAKLVYDKIVQKQSEVPSSVFSPSLSSSVSTGATPFFSTSAGTSLNLI